MGYISLTEFKNTAELIGYNFADYDAEQAISAASAAIDEYCGRRFTSDASGATVERRYTALEGQYITIDDLVSAATVQTDWDGDGVYETAWAAGTDYVLEPFNAAVDGKPYEQLRRFPASSLYFPCWPGSVSVVGQWGWPAVPAQVKEAATIMATRLLKRAREAPFGVVGYGIEGAAVRISKIDPDVCFLLDNLTRGQGVLAA